MTTNTPTTHDDLGVIPIDGSGFENEEPSGMEPLEVEQLDIELPPDSEENGVKNGN